MLKKGTILLIGSILAFLGKLSSVEADQMNQISSEESSLYVTFTPPKGWRSVNPKDLPKSVKFMVVGQGSQTFPPSINLGTESFSGTLKDYLNMIKEINSSQGAAWKDLGKIDTLAGQASLSQVDAETEWGHIRMMHVILIKAGTAYILTAAALKEEFPKYYKEFFASMKSLNFADNHNDVIANEEKKTELSKLQNKLEGSFISLAKQKQINLSDRKERENLFDHPEFQNEVWMPFQEKFMNSFASFGEEWQLKYLEKAKSNLLNRSF